MIVAFFGHSDAPSEVYMELHTEDYTGENVATEQLIETNNAGEAKYAALGSVGAKLRGKKYTEQHFTGKDTLGNDTKTVAMVWNLKVSDLLDNTLEINIENLAREVRGIPQNIDWFLEKAFFEDARDSTGTIMKPIFTSYGAIVML